MNETPKSASRRTVLISAAAAAAGLPLLAAAGSASAEGTTPQASVKYQPKPSGAYHCSLCNYYLPGASATAPGKCKVVAGQISPQGWCVLFAAKH